MKKITYIDILKRLKTACSAMVNGKVKCYGEYDYSEWSDTVKYLCTKLLEFEKIKAIQTHGDLSIGDIIYDVSMSKYGKVTGFTQLDDTIFPTYIIIFDDSTGSGTPVTSKEQVLYGDYVFARDKFAEYESFVNERINKIKGLINA